MPSQTVTDYLTSNGLIYVSLFNDEGDEDTATLFIADEKGQLLGSGGESYDLLFTPGCLNPREHGFETFKHCYVTTWFPSGELGDLSGVIGYRLAQEIAKKHRIVLEPDDHLDEKYPGEFSEAKYLDCDSGIFIAQASPYGVNKIVGAIREYDRLRYSGWEDSEFFTELVRRAKICIDREIGKI